MGGRIIKTAFQVSTFLSIAYFLRGCYLENRDIRIEPVSQNMTWIYDIVTPLVIGERMYYVLIDGELDQDAKLDIQTQRMTSNLDKNDTTYADLGTMRLPRGKFAVYYNRDDSGPEQFVYHPLKATKGWVHVQISPGSWINKDSSRTHAVFQSFRSYPVQITKKDDNSGFKFYPKVYVGPVNN